MLLTPSVFSSALLFLRFSHSSKTPTERVSLVSFSELFLIIIRMKPNKILLMIPNLYYQVLDCSKELVGIEMKNGSQVLRGSESSLSNLPLSPGSHTGSGSSFGFSFSSVRVFGLLTNHIVCSHWLLLSNNINTSSVKATTHVLRHCPL